ncbi:MAG: cupin-like domain-containing protein [Acidobacteriota bacterium]|nr:cupin-like domain-containing protein [Acidobacteriota bacterium]
MDDIEESKSDWENRRWIADRLLSGVAERAVIDELCVLGLAPAAASSAVRAALASPYMIPALTHARRIHKAEALLQFYTQLWRRSASGSVLPEVTSLQAPDFAERYYYRNRPVIIRSGARHWPAVGKWTPQFFKENFSDAPVEYMSGANRYDGDRRRHATMSEFVDRLDETPARNDFYIVATNSLLKNHGLASLSGDLAPLPFAPDMNLQDPSVTRFWFGPRGTITALHHDIMNVLFVQVYGTKEIVLAPSSALPLIYNDRGLRSQVDPIAIDLQRFPRAANIPWQRVVVNAGDVLFIPVGWWHWVYAKSTSISIGCGNFKVGSVYDEWRSADFSPRVYAPPVKLRNEMINSSERPIALEKSAYEDLARALEPLNLFAEAKAAVAGVADGEDREQLLGEVLDRHRLPVVFYDLLAYGKAVRRVRSRGILEAPSVSAITPWLRAPWERFTADYPIRAFIRLEVDDAMKIGQRRTEYLLVADVFKPGRTILAEVESQAFLDGLAACEPLEVLLRRTRDVNLWIGWLHALAKAGIVFWLSPN